MLNPSEKAYTLALGALKHKQYHQAAEQFDLAAGYFVDNKEFNLLRESTKLLVAVQDELAGPEDDDKLVIEEVFSNGKETNIPG